MSSILPRFSAVVLAGGRSRRMGRDKARVKCSGQPMVVRQLHLVQALGPVEVFSRRASMDDNRLGCAVLRHRFPEAWPLAGIERALAIGSAPLVLVMPVDMPLLEEGFSPWPFVALHGGTWGGAGLAGSGGAFGGALSAQRAHPRGRFLKTRRDRGVAIC